MSQRIIHNNIEQRSPEWYKLREGRITGTSVSSILGKITLQKTLDAIDNLAIEKAIEHVHGMIENDFISFDMQRGIDNEPSAFASLEEQLGEQFITLEKVGFVSLGEHVGYSPDGLASNKYGAEIKCHNALNYFKYVLKGVINPVYYAQMQHGMYCLDVEHFYFFNYCVHMGKEYTNTTIVDRDEEMIKTIQERIEIVTEKKLLYIERLLSGNTTSFLASPIPEGILIEKI